MPCRNVGMIVTCLRALAIVGERINIDEELGGEIVKDRIGDVDVGLQTEAGMPHKRDLRCQTEAVGRAIAATRSEEHTSELPSLMRNSYAVFCLKKKKTESNKSKESNK